MAVGPAGMINDANVPPQNNGGVLPKQVEQFKEAIRSTTPNDASGTQGSKGEHAAELSQDTSKSFAIVLATRPPINLGNQIGQQGAPSQTSTAPTAVPSQAGTASTAALSQADTASTAAPSQAGTASTAAPSQAGTASTAAPEYVPSVGATERAPPGAIPKGHAEVIGRLDLDAGVTNNTIVRDRIESVAKELDIDPGLLAATLAAEKGGFSPWSRTSGNASGEDLGLDDWTGKVKDKVTGAITTDETVPNIEKAIIKDHPNLGLKFGDMKETGAWWDVSTENPHGQLKPRTTLDSTKAVAAAGVYLKMQETLLRRAIENTHSGQNLDDLLPEERLTVLRVAFNGGVGIARDLFVRLVKGGDIQRTGSAERNPNNAGRTAVLHMARAMHLDQTVFGRDSSEYRPNVTMALRRMGATISVEDPPQRP
jgi:hypothetical protein